MEDLEGARVSTVAAIAYLRKVIYDLNIADKTINELLDEGNDFAYSVLSDIAALKGIQRDITFLQKEKL